MEAAALFAVAEVHGLRLASAFVISDSLADLVWGPRFHDPAVQDGLIGLYQAAVAALTTVPVVTAERARRGGGLAGCTRPVRWGKMLRPVVGQRAGNSTAATHVGQ